MIEGPELHPDLGALVIVDTGALTWEETPWDGVFFKPCERLTEPGTEREVCLYRFAADAAMDAGGFGDRMEIMVIDGDLSDGHGEHGPGVFLRYPPEAPVRFTSANGCVLFSRCRRGVGHGGSEGVWDTNDRSLWQAWGGRGNQRITLSDPVEPDVGAWLGYMFPEHQAPEHAHRNGEEIFVLHGSVEDQTGVYGPGTWGRYPVGYRHRTVAHSGGALLLVWEGDVRS